MSHDDPQGSGEFLAIDVPSRLVYTFRWEEPDPDDTTEVTLSLRDIGDATQLTLRQGEFATVALLALHRNGGTDSLDKLRALGRTRTPPGVTPPAPAGRRQAGVAAGTLTA